MQTTYLHNIFLRYFLILLSYVCLGFLSYSFHTEFYSINVKGRRSQSRSKAWIVFASSDAGVVDSNPTQGMDICCVYAFILCLACPVFFGSGLGTDWSLVQGVLPSVKMITELNKRPRPRMGWRASVKKKFLTDTRPRSPTDCVIKITKLKKRPRPSKWL
jgi:hypothetical protein